MHWLSFFIGALVGWLIGWLFDFLICRPRRMAVEADLRGKLESVNTESAALKAQLSAHIERLNADLAATRVIAGGLGAAAGTALADPNLEVEVDQAAARTSEVDIAVTPPVAPERKPDDLIVIEGIGAKISELLAQNDIHTFAQLAATSVERLRAILDSGGPRFRTAHPDTWPEQALFARDGDWDALKALQDSLQGGRLV